MANTKAQAAKEQGNACFKAGKYADAVGHYTAAILAAADADEDEDVKEPTFHLNRAAAYLRLGKNEDAERDCTIVLGMRTCTGNTSVKALYRRAQARVALGRLALAEEDLKCALERETANADVLEELRKVRALREVERKRKEKTLKPPQRRRVPIKIVDSSTSPSTSTSTPPSHVASPKTTPTSDTLRAVSTRSLKPADVPAPAAPVSPPMGAPAAPGGATRSFKDAKKVRENSRPSRVVVGGGIFRASGENTIFTTRSAPVPASASVSEDAKAEVGPEAEAEIVPIVPVPPAAPPKTCFEFVRAWEAQTRSGIEMRWGLILSVLPSGVPALFKTALEPALLVSILAVFQGVLGAAGAADGGETERVRAYMDAFGQVQRFGTVVLFLSRAERALARDVWEALGVTKEDLVDSAWKSVWK